MSPSGKPRVAVIFGGRSTEHSISCVSAGSVLRALARDRYDVVPIGISPQGRWVPMPDEPAALEIVDGTLPQVHEADGAGMLPGDLLDGVEVVFPILHGPYGEDGTIQGLLELSGIPYVGSGVLSSAASMDKAYMKLVLAGCGLPVGPYVTVAPRDWGRDPGRVATAVAELGWPVFVKPARGGSSVGISKVSRSDDLAAAVEVARDCDPKVVVEAMIAGREIECGVLEGLGAGAPEASVPAEIRVKGEHEFYDFEAKYLDDATDLDVPADLPDDVTKEIQRLAVAAFEALSCEGLARVDFFCGDDGAVVVNEVNTMPGFTPSSMFPLMWQASGLDYPALVDRLIQTALQRPTGLR